MAEPHHLGIPGTLGLSGSSTGFAAALPPLFSPCSAGPVARAALLRRANGNVPGQRVSARSRRLCSSGDATSKVRKDETQK